MKKSFIFLAAIIILTQQFSTAQTLYGYIHELNSGNKPVGNVVVKGTLANQVITTDKGEYTLKFQTGKPGKTVYIKAEKEGWVVTDLTKLSPNLPSDALRNPHIIVVCEKDKWNRLIEQSKEVCEKGMHESYEKRKSELEKKITTLSKTNNNYQHDFDSLINVIEQLEQQYQNQRHNIAKFAEEHSKQNLDEITQTELEAYQLFNEGKIEKSLALRESMKSIENIEKRNADNKSLQQTIANNKEANEIDRRNLKQQAKEAQLLFKWDKVETVLEYLARDSTDLDALFNYGNWLLQNFEINKSKKVLSQYLIGNSTKSEYGRYKIFNSYEVSYDMLTQNPALVLFILNSESIIDDTKIKNDSIDSEKQSWFDLYDVMDSSQTNKLYDILIREITKRKYIEIKYEIFDDFQSVKHFNDLLTEKKSRLLSNNLTEIVEKNNIEDSLSFYKSKLLLTAIKYYNVALETFSAFTNNPIKPDSIFELSNKYCLQKAKDITNLSLNSLLFETLIIYEYLLFYDPKNCEDFHRETTSLIYKNAEIISNSDYYNQIEEYFYNLTNRIDASNNTNLLYIKSVALDEQADYFLSKKNDSTSINFIKSILKNRYYLAKINPAKYELKLANTLHILGDLYKNQKEFVLAVSVFIEELDIRKKLVVDDSESKLYQYTQLQGNLSWLYLLTKVPRNAEIAVKEALNPSISTKKINDFDQEIEWVNTNLAHALLFQGKYKEAKKIYLKYKNKPLWNHDFKYYFLQDFDELEKNGITHPDITKIKELLK